MNNKSSKIFCDFFPDSDTNINPIHLWNVNLKNKSQIWIDDLKMHIINEDEVDRSEQFVKEEHRYNFIAARGILRILLAKYLKIPPSCIVFGIGEHGKLFIDVEKTILQITSQERRRSDKVIIYDTDRLYALKFNVSHSGYMASFAFCKNDEIGVDVEYVKKKFSIEEISEKYFGTELNNKLVTFKKSKKIFLYNFFRYWTLYESVIKALGSGIFELEKRKDFDILSSFPMCVDKDIVNGKHESEDTVVVNRRDYMMLDKIFYLFSIDAIFNYPISIAIIDNKIKIHKDYLHDYIASRYDLKTLNFKTCQHDLLHWP